MSNWVENSRFAYILQHQGAFAHGGELKKWSALFRHGAQRTLVAKVWKAYGHRGEKISIFQSLMQSSVGTVCPLLVSSCCCPLPENFSFPEKYASDNTRDTLYPKAQSSRDYWPYSSVRNYNSKERNILHNSLFLISKKGKKKSEMWHHSFFNLPTAEARHHI